ncbi:MAG: restriction endonuclease subunit S [Candidatus Aenigmatarchaeota archaeon]
MMFYKETNFKETSIGKIPKDWEVVTIGDNDYFEIIPSGIKKFDGKKLYLSTKCIDGIRIVDIEGEITFTERPSRANMQPMLNSVWFAKMKNTIKVYIFTEKNVTEIDKYILSTGFCGIRCKENVEPEYLKQIFLSKLFNRIKDSLVTGSTQQDIKQKDIEKIKLPYPPLLEQQKIAEILSTFDEAIQKTNEIIAKTERLKKGLMQELLTKGIGHKEFKDTEIGRIPKEWEVVKLGDRQVAEIRGNKIISIKNKIAFIPMELIPDQEIFAKYEVRDPEDVRSSTYCEAGDLLLAKITPSLENGKQGIVPEDVPNGFALATTEVYPIICKGINRLFLFYILKLPKFRKILEFSMRGTTGRLRVPKEAVEKLRIPLPSLSEQQKIAEILLTVDKKLELERNEKARLERIKQALMDLLLTGKIRIKVN